MFLLQTNKISKASAALWQNRSIFLQQNNIEPGAAENHRE